MANSLSEGFARVTYSGLNPPHHAMLPINFDGTPTPGVEPSLTQKDGTNIAASVGILAYLDVFQAMFNNDTLFGLVELYQVDPDTEERTFIYGFDAGVTGSSGAENVEFAALTLSFKTVFGGVLKVVAMEGVSVPNFKITAPFPSGSNLKAWSDYVVSDDSIIIGRDNAVPFAPIAASCKYNDALRAKAGL